MQRSFSEASEFEDYRGYLFAIAYRMLGSVMEAEDAVQEAYLRYQAADQDQIQSARAFLSTIVTRLCLDQLKSARMKREQYYGEWLPEPLLTADNPFISPSGKVQEMESISMAFLVLLEKLSPAERAVFLLREVFDYDYSDIAGIVEKNEATCRKLFSRAKQHLQDNRPRFEPTQESHQQILMKFMAACQVGDLQGLTELLAEDVTSWTDGGGKIAAALHPIYGADKVARFIIGLFKQSPPGITLRVTQINGQPGIIVYMPDGEIAVVAVLHITDNHINGIRYVRNPEKLAHLYQDNSPE